MHKEPSKGNWNLASDKMSFHFPIPICTQEFLRVNLNNNEGITSLFAFLDSPCRSMTFIKAPSAFYTGLRLCAVTASESMARCIAKFMSAGTVAMQRGCIMFNSGSNGQMKR